MIYSFENFTLDTKKHVLSKDGVEVDVEPQVFALIQLLVENHDRLISKEEIYEKIWDGRIVSESSISTRINQARAVLADDGRNQRLIKTVHIKGFRFVGELEGLVPNDAVPDQLDNLSVAAYMGEPPSRTPVKWLAPALALAGILLASGYFLTKEHDSAPETTVETGKSFDITQYKIGDTIAGGSGIDTLDLSAYEDGGMFVGLLAEKARDLDYEKGKGEYNIVGIENLIGTPQNDIFRGSIVPNILKGGPGDDQLYSYGDADIIYGGEGDDLLNGGYQVDEVYGGPGNDRILVATISEGDHIDGGPGIDTFDLSKFTHSGYSVDLEAGVNFELEDRGQGKFRIAKIENVIGTGLDDVITGDARDNVLTGGAGDDQIDGSGGSDTAIFSGVKADYELSKSEGMLTVTHISGGDGSDVLSNIEVLKFSDTSIPVDR